MHHTGAQVHCTSQQINSVSVRFPKQIIPRVCTVYISFAPINMGKTGAERLRESLERKKQKKRERNARFYEKNKDRILEERKEQRRRKKPRIAVEEQSEGALPKPNWRLYKARQRARKRQEKEKTSSKSIAVSPNAVREAFSNRTARKRAVDATKNSLPRSPRKKVAVVASLVTSPSTRQSLQRLGYVNSPENEEEVQVASSILQDATAAQLLREL